MQLDRLALAKEALSRNYAPGWLLKATGLLDVLPRQCVCMEDAVCLALELPKAFMTLQASSLYRSKLLPKGISSFKQLPLKIYNLRGRPGD